MDEDFGKIIERLNSESFDFHQGEDAQSVAHIHHGAQPRCNADHIFPPSAIVNSVDVQQATNNNAETVDSGGDSALRSVANDLDQQHRPASGSADDNGHNKSDGDDEETEIDEQVVEEVAPKKKQKKPVNVEDAWKKYMKPSRLDGNTVVFMFHRLYS